MRRQELEAWVLDVCEAALDGHQVEDDRVELKTTWPTPDRKVARQIAGHSNAAMGSTILWIFGVDERGCRIVSSQGHEPADWWAQARRHFAGVEPELLDVLAVPIAKERVVALLFATDRAPYVVSTDGHGGVEREVPWRTANSTRSAHRSDLLRVLVGQAHVPQAEVLQASAQLMQWREEAPRVGPSPEHLLTLRVNMQLFISAAHPAHLPEHRQSLTVRTANLGTLALGDFVARGPYGAPTKVSASGMRYGDPLASIVVAGDSGLQVNTSDRISLTASTAIVGEREIAALRGDHELELGLQLGVDRSTRAVLARCTLIRKEDGDLPAPEEYDHQAVVAAYSLAPADREQ